MKLLAVEGALLCVKSWTDGRTDVTTLIVAFYNCCDCAPKKILESLPY